MVDIRAVVAGVCACVAACGGGDDDAVEIDAACTAAPSFCSGRTEDVCEDFDGPCFLGAEWTSIGSESSFSLRPFDDAPSQPRAADVRVPAFADRFETAAYQRHLDGTWNVIRVETAWRNGGLGYRAQQGFADVIWIRPDVVGDNETFVLTFQVHPDGIRVGRVASGNGGGNYFEMVGALPPVGTWTNLRIDLAVRPGWAFEAFVDGQRVAGGAIPSTLTATTGVTVAFGLSLGDGPLDASQASYDNLTVDLVVP